MATFTNPKNTEMTKKHTGILEQVTAAQSYASPALINNDVLFMEGRSFTVMAGDVSELKDYDRTKANDIDNVQIEETEYRLDKEKFWGRYVDALDKRDTEGNIDVEYVVGKQAAKVVAPFLDEIRFEAMARNAESHLTVGEEESAQYDAALDASEALDEAGAAEAGRILFVTPSFYKGIKKFVVALPQGDAEQRVLGRGVQGEVDGFLIVKVPSKYLQGVQAIAVPGQVLASPLQVDATEVIEKQAGRFGETVQQLLYTGAFVPKQFHSKMFTIGGTEVTGDKDGKDVHAPEEEPTP